MKRILFIGILLCCCGLIAAQTVLRDNILPGAVENAQWYKAVTVNAPAAPSGMLSLWVRPEKWDADDKGVYSVVQIGSRQKNDLPAMEFYRQKDGSFRVLWCLDVQKKLQGNIIVRSPQIVPGKWVHLALTWQSNGKSTMSRLWINGRLAGSHWMNFVWGKDGNARQWHINDQPAWAKNSGQQRVAVGKIAVFDRVLPENELKMLAQEKLLTGEDAFVDRSFLPLTEKNKLTGEITVPVGKAVMELKFTDENGKTFTRTLPLELDKKRMFDIAFAMDADSHDVSFTLKDENGKFPPWRIRNIVRDPGLPPLEPNYWQASWLLPNDPPGTPARKNGSSIYYIKEFELDLTQVAKAGCQYIGSNNGTAYINGHDLGRTFGWTTPKAVADVLPYLKNGKNVFCGNARIPFGPATFMGELTLVMKDGTVRYIASGTDWRYLEVSMPDKGVMDFDYGKLPFAVSNTRPPQLPYGETRYTNFAPIPEIKFAGLPYQWHGVAGKTVDFNLTAPCRKIDGNIKVWLKLIKGDREFFRMPLALDSREGVLGLSGSLTLPDVSFADTYTVELESRSLIFPEKIGELTVSSAGMPAVPLKAELRKVNGISAIHINGKAVPALLQRSAINFRNDTTGYRFTGGIDRAGVRFVETNLYFNRLWLPDGSINTAEVDLYLQSSLFYAPNSYLIVYFNTDAPPWYLKENPGERFISDKGVKPYISYGSQKYRKDSTAFFRKVIEYMKQQPYFNRVAGIGMDGGDDGQFMQWSGNGRTFVGDYSVPMRDYFHEYLRKKYGTVEELNNQWQSSYKDFADIAVPSPQRRQGDDTQPILDPVKDADIVDFNLAYSSCVADLICDYAAMIKSATDRTRLVAAYYGKFFSIYGILQWAELDIERILRNPDFDYLVAVDYIERPVGRPHELIVPAASYRKHNKLFVDEADIRTYITGAAKWAKTGSLFEFASQARKMFMKSRVNGMGLHWYDIYGGMFENSALWRTIGNIQNIAAVDPVSPVVPAEIALIADEKSYAYCTYAKRLRFKPRQDSAFGFLGAPYDVWFLSDLGKPGFPEYKMYVFLNALAPTAEQRQAINDLKRDGKLLVFLHNSGYINGRSKSVENVSDLTGIKMAESGALQMVMRFDPAVDGGTLFQKVEKILHANCGNADTAAVAVDPDAEKFGSFLNNSVYKPMAYKKFKNWRSFYSTVGLLPLDLWRELARSAGVHLYVDNDPDCIVYIGSELLGIHSANGGRKVLKFPGKRTFIEAVTGEVLAVNTDAPAFDIIPGETRIIRIK